MKCKHSLIFDFAYVINVELHKGAQTNFSFIELKDKNKIHNWTEKL